MEIRGQRHCQSCGNRWSYYDTGSVTCPECGSIRSVGVDDRTRHTSGDAELDLATAQAAAAEDELDEAAEAAESACAEYIRARGFIHAGELCPLDNSFVGAHELRRAGAAMSRTMRPSESAERYFVALLTDVADGSRPDPELVPQSLRHARGLGSASAIDAYLREVVSWHEDRSADQSVTRLTGRIRDHVKRVEALDGDVPATTADRLVTAARALGVYAAGGDPEDAEAAQAALDALS